MLGDTQLKKKKPLKLVLMLSLVYDPSPVSLYFSTRSLRLTQIIAQRDYRNLLPPAYTCWIKRVLHNLQWPDALSQRSSPRSPPEKSSLLTFQRKVNRCGQMNYSLCFPYVQFFCNCTTCNFVSCTDSHVFPSCGLFARQLIVFEVCIFKRNQMTTLCIVGAFVRFSWLDLSVCCHFILDKGFYLLCSWSWCLPWKHCLLSLEGNYTVIIKHHTHFSHDANKCSSYSRLHILETAPKVYHFAGIQTVCRRRTVYVFMYSMYICVHTQWAYIHLCT